MPIFEQITAFILKNSPVDSAAKTNYGFERARIIIPFIYFFVLFRAFMILGGWQFSFPYPENNFSPGWSLFWVKFLTFQQSLAVIQLLFLFGAIAGAFFYNSKLARSFTFVGVLQYHALISSFGPVDHGWILWLWILFILIFLPNTWNKERPSFQKRRVLLFIFWSAQVLVLMMYSLAGLGKLYGAFWQITRNQVSVFAPDSLALHISDWFLRTNYKSLFGPFLVNNPLLGWPFFIGAIYVHFFSLWIAFKPEIHRLWGFLLVLIHIGIFLSMGVALSEPIFLIPLLFFNSPFQRFKVSWKEILSTLPLFGWGFARFLKNPTNLRLLRSWS